MFGRRVLFEVVIRQWSCAAHPPPRHDWPKLFTPQIAILLTQFAAKMLGIDYASSDEEDVASVPIPEVRLTNVSEGL